MPRMVVGISGASGVILAQKAVSALVDAGYQIDFIMSSAACHTAALELGNEYSSPSKFVASFPESTREQITVHSFNNCGASIASGSFQTEGMIIIPCSMASVAAIACGLGDNLLRRAADVVLKERRKLVIVPRESPFSEIHLENMLKLSRMGAMIVPPIPAWYNGSLTLDDVENFIVGKALDALRVDNELYTRWA